MIYAVTLVPSSSCCKTVKESEWKTYPASHISRYSVQMIYAFTHHMPSSSCCKTVKESEWKTYPASHIKEIPSSSLTVRYRTKNTKQATELPHQDAETTCAGSLTATSPSYRSVISRPRQPPTRMERIAANIERRRSD